MEPDCEPGSPDDDVLPSPDLGPEEPEIKEGSNPDLGICFDACSRAPPLLSSPKIKPENVPFAVANLPLPQSESRALARTL